MGSGGFGGQRRSEGFSGLPVGGRDAGSSISSSRSLLTSMAARLGSILEASKCWRVRPPLRVASVWQTAQYFITRAVCSGGRHQVGGLEGSRGG